MANAAAISVSFLKEALSKTHNIDNGGDSLKAALYYTTGTVTHTTTAYSATSEVTGTNYTAGGVAVTTGAGCLNSSSKTAYWTPTANFSWGTLSATGFDAVHVYNVTASSKSVMTATFSAQTVTAADFTLTMPTNNSTSALMRITGP